MVLRRRGRFEPKLALFDGPRHNNSTTYWRHSFTTILLCYYLVASFIVQSATQLTPVIGGTCKLNSPDVQIGGKQTQFFLRCESNVESQPGEGVWVVKSKNAANTATRIPASAVVEAESQPLQKKAPPKSMTHQLVCELDSNARESMPCATSETCLQPVYTDSNAYLQCDSSLRRWVKKHCQRGFAFSFEHQSCVAHSRPQTFRQFPTPALPPPAGGLVCTYSQCSPTAPCPIGTCNNGYCCSPAAAPLTPAFAAACPGGGQPYGGCNAGYCSPGYQCVQPNNICCAPPAYACPGGVPSVGSCIGGRCGPGYACSPTSNVCCAQMTQAIPATVCPDGTQAAGACVNGQCGQGFTCNQGLCCANSSQTPRCLDGSQAIGACIQGSCGTGYTCTTGNICCPSTLNACPNGQVSIGACVNGRCPAGYTCINNQCCGASANVLASATCAREDSHGPCLDGTCPEPGYVCDTANNWCCPQVMGDPVGPCIRGEGGARLCPDGYACVGPDGGQCRRLDTGTCAPQDQSGPCASTDPQCPDGFTCLNGFCCSNDSINTFRARRMKRVPAFLAHIL